MHQLSSRKSNNIKNKCYFLVTYQLSSIVLLLLSGIIWETYSNASVIFIAMIVYVILSCIAVYKLYVNSTCPKCGRNFFYKEDNPINLGFSFYTHRCTNCKYKIRNGE